jgi:hypothetical protein
MTRAAQDVIDRFKLLSPDEQTAAYIEIEEAWKSLPDGGTLTPQSSSPPNESSRSTDHRGEAPRSVLAP